MTLDDARSGGLLAVGSRARYRLMAAGDERAVADFSTFIKAHKPDSGELITVEQSQQNLRSAFDRGEAFLRLAALLAALLSGIAVALASQRYARRKTDEVALLRCLGASGGEVTVAIGTTLGLLAIPACAIGAALGLAMQQFVFAFARELLPVTSSMIPIGPSIAAFAVGLAVLFGFSLPPLLRLRDVPPVRIFQRAAGNRVRRFDALYLIPFAVSALLIYLESDTPKLATILSASLFGVAIVSLLAGVDVDAHRPQRARHGGCVAVRSRQSRAPPRVESAADRRARARDHGAGFARRRRSVAAVGVARGIAGGHAELFPDQHSARAARCRHRETPIRGRGKYQRAAAGGEQARRDQRHAAARGRLSRSPRRRMDQRRNALVVERRRAAVESCRRGALVFRASERTGNFRRRNVDRDVPSETRRHLDVAHRRSRSGRARHERARRALGFVPREFFPAARSGQCARHRLQRHRELSSGADVGRCAGAADARLSESVADRSQRVARSHSRHHRARRHGGNGGVGFQSCRREFSSCSRHWRRRRTNGDSKRRCCARSAPIDGNSCRRCWRNSPWSVCWRASSPRSALAARACGWRAACFGFRRTCRRCSR